MAAPGLGPSGSLNWGGAYGRQYFVDPAEHLVVVLLINHLPNRADIGGKYQARVYQALMH